MNLGKFLKGVVIVLLLLGTGKLVVTETTKFIDFSNTEIALTTKFKQHEQERITFYDKAYKQVKGSAQIALRNDSSFYRIVDLVMVNQPSNINATLGMIRLIDPSANYNEVSKFYEALLAISNQNREGFFQQEKELQSINADHENLINQFPGSLYNTVLRRSSFNYIPITSTLTKQVEKTHTDDNTSVF